MDESKEWGQISSIEELCAFLATATPEEQEEVLTLVGFLLIDVVGVDVDTTRGIVECIADVFGIPIPIP